MVKFSDWPIFDQEDIDAVANVVKSGKWWCGAPKSHAGENVWKLQEEYAKFNESKFAWPCTNGTHAIEIVLLAMNIGIGDEVIVSDWTFVASGGVVVSVGAVPVFCEPDPETFVMDSKKIESLITPRTKAIICVHLGGMPCEMDKIMEISKKHNLKVIEDCAHAHGSRYKGKRVGNWGDAGTFSFQASKVMTAGEGGMIVCNDDALSARIYEVLDSGRHPGAWFYDHFVYGSNYRLSEFNAALMRTQLKKYPAQLAKRNESAKYLNAELAKIPGVHPQKRSPDVNESGNYTYPVYFEPDKFGGITYKEMYKELNALEIPTDACYPPLHRLDCFKNMQLKKGIDYSKGNFGGAKSDDKNFPVVTKLHANTFQFGQEVLLSEKEALDFAIKAIKDIQKKYQKTSEKQPEKSVEKAVQKSTSKKTQKK